MVLPDWIEQSLRCPITGVALSRQNRDGQDVYVAEAAEGEPLVYPVVNGVPHLAPGE